MVEVDAELCKVTRRLMLVLMPFNAFEWNNIK